MTQRTEVLFPIGRLVMGSMVKPNTTDAENRPLVIKSGPQAGQPRLDYFFAVAIPKNGTANWWDTEWGQKILATANTAFPNGQTQNPAFAWKVKDGDSQVPNKRGKKPCDQEGWPGNWIVYFSSGFAPKCFNSNGTQPVDAESIKLGHYVQVLGTVAGNDSQQQPGVFINHSLVAHAGFGPEIFVGPDPTAVGFGNGPAPAGMSTAPVGGMTPPAGAGAPPAVPSAGAPPMTPAASTPPVAAPVPTAPHPAAMMPPAAPAAAAPPAAAVKQMTAAAQGIPYADYIAKGWTDQLLIQHGLMIG